jgi:hypothetical protein
MISILTFIFLRSFAIEVSVAEGGGPVSQVLLARLAGE